MRYLGIDYGAKRVGVAVSDETGSLAFPLVVLENSGDLVEKIAKICKESKINEVVVGESLDFDQKENEIMKQVAPFVKNLKKITLLSVHMHPEFLTSAEAERLQGKNDMLDASAASLILKHFLDTKRI